MGLLLHRRRLVVLLALPVLGLGACGGGDDSDGEGQQGGPAQAKAPEAPALEVLRPESKSATRSARITVEGTVTEGATVKVGGKRAKIEGPANDESRNRWSAKVALDRGRNVIEVVANLEGKSTIERLVVSRKAKASEDSPDGGSGEDGDTADASPPGGSQGGPPGGSPPNAGGSQGGSGGSEGGSGGSQGGSGGSQGGGVGGPPPDDGNQGGSGGGGGDQGGPPGAAPDGGQGGPPAAPPPGTP